LCEGRGLHFFHNIPTNLEIFKRINFGAVGEFPSYLNVVLGVFYLINKSI